MRPNRFHPSRRWRFDCALPEHRVAVEVEGGVWRSSRGSDPPRLGVKSPSIRNMPLTPRRVYLTGITLNYEDRGEEPETEDGEDKR